MDNSHIASALLNIKAVRISTNPPFTWSSGWKSPIYCDNRLTLSYPEIRGQIRDGFVKIIQERYPEATGILGVATGAIAGGVLVAEAMGLPFIYARSKAKGHGMGNLIEGVVDPNGKYVIIEDLVSTGKSSVKAVQALQETGATVLATLAIFSYGFPQADEAFEKTGTPYFPLTNLAELLRKAEENNYLQPEEKETIFKWQKDQQTGSFNVELLILNCEHQTMNIHYEFTVHNSQLRTMSEFLDTIKKSTIQDYIVDVRGMRMKMTIEVKPENIYEVLKVMKESFGFNYLSDITGSDNYTDEKRFEVSYNIVNLEGKQRIRVACQVEEDNPTVDSAVSIWSSADWFEREVFDMLGITFNDHPDLRRMYMPEDYKWYPLRKEFPLLGIPGSIELPEKDPPKEYR